MCSIVTSVPKLGKGQKVKDWRRLYLAATSLVTDKQKIELLPVYAARNQAEIHIAEVCTKKATIAEALNLLESLIDGAPSTLVKFNDFWDCKPSGSNYQDMMAFYFVLANEGVGAGIPKHMIIMRFLKFVPRITAEKIFTQHKAIIIAAMTDDNMAAVFKTVQEKMMLVTKSDPGAGSSTSVKEEPEEHVFLAESEPPAWAQNLCQDVEMLKVQMAGESWGDSERGEDNVMMFKPKSSQYVPGPRRILGKCWICQKAGHRAEACYQRVCGKCGKKGHSENVCNAKMPGGKRAGL